MTQAKKNVQSTQKNIDTRDHTHKKVQLLLSTHKQKKEKHLIERN
jgi:hypothetical protein